LRETFTRRKKHDQKAQTQNPGAGLQRPFQTQKIMLHFVPETYQSAEKKAIEAARAGIEKHYKAAREELSKKGLFGETLDRKARKLALKKAGFTLPENWTIAMVTPLNHDIKGRKT
jgi:ribosomal protein L16/L10AE